MEARSFAPVEYRLGSEVARRRARVASLFGSLALLAPGTLVAVLVAGQGAFANPFVLTTALLLVVLAGVRAWATHGRLLRGLSRLHVRLDERALVIRVGQRSIELGPEAIERVVEIAGSLGGLRVRIADGQSDAAGEMPRQVDIPRGGERFAELHRALLSFAPAAVFAPRRRRSPAFRWIRGVLVVATVFFLPFVAVDFLHRSRLLAYGVALLLVVVVRAVMRPRW